jgi:hypothetical protein
MHANEIRVGNFYVAKVNGRHATVKVLEVVEKFEGLPHFVVVNVLTGRKTTFKSAAKFRSPAKEEKAAPEVPEVEGTVCERSAGCLEAGDSAGEQCSHCGGTVPRPFVPTASTPVSMPTTPRDRPTVAPVAAASPGDKGTPTTPTSAAVSLAGQLAANPMTPAGRGPGQPPHLVVEARAGTGKTTTLVCALQVLKGETPYTLVPDPKGGPPVRKTITPSPQQKAIWDAVARSRSARSVCFVAFNKSIATELQRRVPAGCEAMTMHSMGFRSVTWAFGRLEVSEYVVVDHISALLGVDVRTLRQAKPVVLKAVAELVGLCKVNLMEPTPENLAYLADYYDVELAEEGNRYGRGIADYSAGTSYREEIFGLVPEVLDLCKKPQGRIDYNDMIWLPVVLDLPVFKNDLLLVDEAQDLNRCQQALARKAGKRLVLCGDPKQCLLPGTKVTMEGGSKLPIEKLWAEMDHHKVVTYNPNAGRFSGRMSQGRKVEKFHEHQHDGEIVEIDAGGSDGPVGCTLNHKWWVRFAPECKDKFCLYLMEREGQFRVGICQMQYSCGMGVSARARSEDADRAWILQVFDTSIEARISEELVAVQHGLPQLVFRNRGGTTPSQDFIDAVYSQLGENLDRAEKCLQEFGRDINLPIWERKGDKGHNYLSVTKGFIAYAANLIDGCFQFRVDEGSLTGRWQTARIARKEYKGPVYGITVEPTERGLRLYLANGLVSHNSIYGFAGADCKSMDRMTEELREDGGCEVLPLTVTRRCGRAIVAEANEIVPDFSAHEDNPEGLVYSLEMVTRGKDGTVRTPPTYRLYNDRAGHGDMVLCRVNAPLVAECFRFLKAGRKANIQGRDVGAGLVSTVHKLVGKDNALTPVVELVRALDDWLEQERGKENAKRNPNEAKLIAIQDRYDCLVCFTEGSPTSGDVVRKIQDMFTDDKNAPGVKLSSIHKAKGLEAHRVFLLEPEGATVPHPMARSAWQHEQELNLRYVAITRAVGELVYVS